MYIDKEITIIIYGKLKLMKIDISSEIHRTGKDLKYIYFHSIIKNTDSNT